VPDADERPRRGRRNYVGKPPPKQKSTKAPTKGDMGDVGASPKKTHKSEPMVLSSDVEEADTRVKTRKSKAVEIKIEKIDDDKVKNKREDDSEDDDGGDDEVVTRQGAVSFILFYYTMAY
jgi:hypothetical protein